MIGPGRPDATRARADDSLAQDIALQAGHWKSDLSWTITGASAPLTARLSGVVARWGRGSARTRDQRVFTRDQNTTSVLLRTRGTGFSIDGALQGSSRDTGPPKPLDVGRGVSE